MHSVLWTPQALNELAAAWTQANSAQRQAITEAAREIDQLLARDPAQVGESRGEFERISFMAPLAFMFEVDSSRRIAFVTHVWRYQTR